MTRACLHIGLNKTGSSSIQKWLGTNAPHLRAHGVVYDPLRQNQHYVGNLHAEFCATISHKLGEICPVYSVRHTLGIKTLETQARIAAQFEEFLKAKVKQSSRDSLFILSSEYLPNCVTTPNKADTLRAFMERYFDDVKIVTYIRRQEDFIPSHWSQLAKYAPIKALDEYVQQHPIRDYAAVLAPFEAAFGVDRIKLRLASPDILSGKSLIEDFCEVLGIETVNARSDVHENKSPSAAALELLRNFTRSHPSHFKTGYMNPRYREFYDVVKMKDKSYSPLTLTKAQAIGIRLANKDSNEIIRKSYFAHRPELFPEKLTDLPEHIDLLPEVTALAIDVAEHFQVRQWRAPGYRYFRDLFETALHSRRTS